MKLLILLSLLSYSCSQHNYSIHERNMQVQYDRMIEHDLKYKKKMTRVRKQASRSKLAHHKIKNKSKFII
jgi:hypothetical protein